MIETNLVGAGIPPPPWNDMKTSLVQIYQLMYDHFGHRDWWPGDTPLEIMIGAILTQNTAWKNVEKAIHNLKKNRLLSLARLRELEEHHLAEQIRPSGYYNQKAKKIKALIEFLDRWYGGSISRMKTADCELLRDQLLQVRGIGPETADSILLYALEKPIFVIDAYTRRIFTRHHYFPSEPGYQEAQEYFHAEFPTDLELYNDFHAQIVATGNRYCRPKPLCTGCPLAHLPHHTGNGEKR
jgi:endonuclease-3 related protein